MIKINENYLKLPGSYLFSEIAKKVAKFTEENPDKKLIYMPCLPENNFVPQIPDEKADIIYLCFPNNPTGAAITKIDLQKWVDYALANNSIIMYDAAYEAYITEDLPHSIYEID